MSYESTSIIIANFGTKLAVCDLEFVFEMSVWLVLCHDAFFLNPSPSICVC